MGLTAGDGSHPKRSCGWSAPNFEACCATFGLPGIRLRYLQWSTWLSHAGKTQVKGKETLMMGGVLKFTKGWKLSILKEILLIFFCFCIRFRLGTSIDSIQASIFLLVPQHLVVLYTFRSACGRALSLKLAAPNIHSWYPIWMWKYRKSFRL